MRIEMTYRGRVQGVGFRAVSKELAREHGVVGWVRNEADGAVALIVEGDKATLETYLEQLRSRMSEHIIDEKRTDKDEERGYSGFEIR